MKKQLIICVDFDGTIVEHKFPEIGPEMPNAFKTLRKLQDAGHRLILWTCREDIRTGQKYLSDAVNYCEENGIKFESINFGLLSTDLELCFFSRKPHCDLFIDDRNLGGFPGWDVVDSHIFGGGNITWDLKALDQLHKLTKYKVI